MKRKVIICPNEEKIRRLKEMNQDSSFCDVKFYTKNEFLEKYYFFYDKEIYFYLIRKYHFHIDVIKTYLDSLYGIEDKEYDFPEVEFLRNLKKELMEENLLHINPTFRNMIKNSSIEISHIYDFDSYVLKDLNYQITLPKKEISSSVYEFSTLEEEVNAVCLEILKLLKDGVSPSKIFLGNVREDYYYTLKRYFSYYHIPINIPFQNSIFTHKKVQDYLKNRELDPPEEILPLLNQYVSYDLNDEVVWKVFLNDLNQIKEESIPITPAVECINIYNRDFLEDEHLFVLGFHQGV